MNHRLRTVAAGTVVSVFAVFALAGPADAHVEATATDATRGGYAVVSFQVPNEQADASTTQVEIQLPTDTPFASASTQPVPGWTVTSTMTKLATPITTDDGQVTEAVSTLTWTAGKGAAIGPGQFQLFPVDLGPLPDAAGVTFKAIQTYSNGDVVKWIETPAPGSTQEPEHPAPVLALAAASSTDGTDHPAAPTVSASPVADSSAPPADTGTATTLSVIALVLAALALAGVGFGLVRGRRSS